MHERSESPDWLLFLHWRFRAISMVQFLNFFSFLFFKSCILFMIHEVGCEGKSSLFMLFLCCTAHVVSVKGLFKQHAL